jgi:hypothetical protein
MGPMSFVQSHGKALSPHMSSSFVPSFIISSLFFFRSTKAITTISTFTDPSCLNPFRSLEGPNGYPNGICTSLNVQGEFGSFQIVEMDAGCEG